MRLFSELRLSSWTLYITNANMAETLAQFLLFLQNEENALKELKIITSMSMLRAAANETESWPTLSRTVVRTSLT